MSEFARSDFEKQAANPPSSFLSDLWLFIRQTKKWWLVPLIAVLLLMGALLAVSSSGAAPFLYTLF